MLICSESREGFLFRSDLLRLLRLNRFMIHSHKEERARQRGGSLPPLDDDGLFMPPMKEPNGLLDAMLICILVFASL